MDKRMGISDVNRPDKVLSAYKKKIRSSVQRKLMRELIEKGILKSFREIKNIDRIDISGVLEDGTQRFIWKEIQGEEQRTALPDDFYLYIPFIKEGVLKYTTSELSFYNHFRVLNVDYEAEKIEVEMSIYKYIDGIYLLDSSYQSVLERVNGEDGAYWSIRVDFKSIISMASLLSFLDVSRMNFTTEEKMVLDSLAKTSKQAERDGSYHDVAGNQAQYFFTTIAGVNYCIERNKALKREKEISGDSSGKVASGEHKVITGERGDPKKSGKRKEIIVWDGVTVSQGEDSKVKVRKGMIINRHTDVWGVAGHIRHFKNGKTVYIKPYKKGPGRESKLSEGKIYKVKKPEHPCFLDKMIEEAAVRADVKGENRGEEYEKIR